MTQSEINWPADVSALRDVLQNGVRIALNGRSDVSEGHLEDFAQGSLLRVLDRLDQFRAAASSRPGRGPSA